jgi:transcriptional regulator GlxA family with amidase domain
MSRAMTLVQETRLSLKEIAWRVGYRHSSNFARDFKLEYGIRPMTARASVNGFEFSPHLEL